MKNHCHTAGFWFNITLSHLAQNRRSQNWVIKAPSVGWKKNYPGLFREYGLAHIVFRNNTFFCEDRQLKFSAFFWFEISWNLTKFQLIQKTLISIFSMCHPISWNFERFHENLNQTNAENFSCLSRQTKKFYS